MNCAVHAGSVSKINARRQDLRPGGIEVVPDAIPSLLEMVQASGYQFMLKASALCEITTPGKNAATFDAFVEDLRLTRAANAA